MFSLWHWIIVLGVVGGLGYAIWRSLKLRRRALVAADGGTLHTAAGPSGLGGWLVLVGLGLIGSIVRVLISIKDDLDLYETQPAHIHNAIYVELALNVALLAAVVWATIMFFRESRSFPMWWKIMAVAAVLVPVIDGVLVAAMLNLPFGKVYTEKEIGQTIATVIAVAIWWWYLNVSVRVKNTFVK